MSSNNKRELKPTIVRNAIEAAMRYTGNPIGDLSMEDTRRLVASLAATESSGGELNMLQKNGGQHIGMYQMSPDFLSDAGFVVDPTTFNEIKNEANQQIKKKEDKFTNLRTLQELPVWINGHSYNEFMNSRQEQDRAFENYHNRYYKALVKNGIIKPGMAKNEILGILKAYHLHPSETRAFKNKGKIGEGDDNHTTVKVYYDDIFKNNDGLDDAMAIANHLGSTIWNNVGEDFKNRIFEPDFQKKYFDIWKEYDKNNNITSALKNIFNDSTANELSKIAFFARNFVNNPIDWVNAMIKRGSFFKEPTFPKKFKWGDKTGKLGNIDPNIRKDWMDLYRKMLITQRDPLTLDLDGDGIETVASNGHKGALFDHDKNGIRFATGWVSKDDGFLVYDRNGDGVVNNGGELFGDNTLLKNGERATNGYQALADLDDNGDGKVDAADSAFAHLRVWRDLNQDGISQEGELLTLDEAKVKALNLANQSSNRDLGNGNTLAEEGTYTDSDGNKKQMGDLNLAADHFHSRYADSLPLTDEQQQAPNLRGSGRVRDLREAAARSPELAEALQQYKNAATKEEQLTLRHENTAMTPGKPCHEYAEKDRLKALQGCNKSVQFPQNTTQTPHNNTWICRNNQHSRTSHDKPTDQYRPQAAASCSVSCLWYCPTLGLQ